MSIGSIGPGGLDDDQAQKVWDSGTAIYTDTDTHPGVFTSPAISCINWHSVILRANPNAGPLLIVLHWYADEALTVEMGKRVFTLDATAAALLCAVLPSLGPWMQIVTTPAALIGPYKSNMTVVLSDRIHPVLVPPITPLLLNVTGNIAAAATKSAVPFAYYGGPVGVSAGGGTGGIMVEITYLYVSFVYLPLMTYSVAPNAFDYRTFIVPPLALKLVVTNEDGMSLNVGPYCNMIASSTGAG